MEHLRQLLGEIDGKGYKSYKRIEGTYQFPGFILSVDHVQGDPYAAPTRISVRLSQQTAAFPAPYQTSSIRRIALEDYLGRTVSAAIARHARGRRGIGKSGEIHIATSGQQVLLRNAVIVDSDGVEARMTVGLPSRGRQVLGNDAIAMLCEEVPAIVAASLLYANLPAGDLDAHVCSVEDQEYLRQWLAQNDLAAFVADGSRLPRRSGIDDRPLDDTIVAFRAPASLRRSVDLPNAGRIQGMGIPRGVTLIVGGGFHGKSTLLHAIEYGVYNHVPGDGREQVATDGSAVKIRAEDGRSITSVNIRPFIDNLPFGKDTAEFSTANASGSTSQAANIMEALECGTRLLLIDEDTSATNFMIRDTRMRALVPDEKEPVTPLLNRVRELYETHGVSTIIVMGGSGDYFAVADTVIMMDTYEPCDVTVQARQVAGPPPPVGPSRHPLSPADGRVRGPAAVSLDPSAGNRPVRIVAHGIGTLTYGRQDIDLARVEQLLDAGQTEAIGLLIHYFSERYASSCTTLVEGLRQTLEDIDHGGLNLLSPYKTGHLALPRLHEIVAAINRMRAIEILVTDARPSV